MLKMLFAIITFVSASSAQTFFFIENYNTVEKSDERRVVSTTDVWIQQNLKGKVGMFVWAQANPIYRQIYAGGSYQFTPWLQAGMGGGVEQADSVKRLGSFVYAAKKNESFFGIYENGGPGRWHLARYTHRFGKSRYDLGFHNQAFIGSGPRAEINLGPVKVWSSALWERHGRNIMVGVRFTHFKEK